MNHQPNILVVIPARGGSKGIPRKNLRSLAGRPLIFYSIRNALASSFLVDVYVSSEDEEILSISEKFGAKVLKRNDEDAQDVVTLDPVIFKAYKQAEAIEKKQYDIIVTLQPTSPLLSAKSLDEALSKLINTPEIDTIISAVNDTHLTWKIENNAYKPNYLKRVNRQELSPLFKETGGFLITRAKNISQSSRIGEHVDLSLLSDKESIDIDSYADWGLCEYYLKRKKLLFVVSGHMKIGLGHVYNTLLLANDIVEHEVLFLVDDESQLAFDKISSKNYPVVMQVESDIVEDIKKLNPDVVINDRLDSSHDYMKALKALGIKTINFEDLGDGAQLADLVINAIYPEREILPKHFFGHKYFILRDEFILTPKRKVSEYVKKVLLTFGGVDPNNYTSKVIQAIQPYCRKMNIEITVVAGFGYSDYESLEAFKDIQIIRNTMNIAELMQDADIIFTSAGRTTYEVAAMQVPTIVMAQNERELTHLFANAEHGFINLGLGTEVGNEKITEAFSSLVENYSSRQYMSKLMAKADLTAGRQRVLKLVHQIVEHA
ncbi:cytidyltransferase [Methylophaga thalassica]|uniref:Cytidyltransferase n=1 Tax=Methylophaga thalassica TaxID=40223 RepID=A0ABQ5TPG3_9GAMM|nr:glycosyltransferase [Methylophaga thalassica]GLP98276.1 cytidyltransferase [Methylophaga thalassica]